MPYFIRYILIWIDYTPHFFWEAPLLHWWRYPFSCHNVVMLVMHCADRLDEAEDVWQYNATRTNLIHELRAKQNSHQSISLKDLFKGL